MKRMMCLSLLLSGAAFATQQAPLEPVVVREIKGFLNLMPGIGEPAETRRSENAVMATVNVASEGCTRPEDFRAYVRDEDGYQVLSIIRISMDPCNDRQPEGVTVTLPVEGYRAHTPLIVANPLRTLVQVVH